MIDEMMDDMGMTEEHLRACVSTLREDAAVMRKARDTLRAENVRLAAENASLSGRIDSDALRILDLRDEIARLESTIQSRCSNDPADFEESYRAETVRLRAALREALKELRAFGASDKTCQRVTDIAEGVK